MAFDLALVAPDRVLADRKAPTKKLGLVFRTDNEARIVSASKHPDNVDISAHGSTGTPIEGFLRHLDQFEHVVTDRLHAAIGAALLGKRVSIVTGSYFKIRAIFKSSIENIFPDCQLVTDEEAIALMESGRD
jgi:exopolysaccharide biosynthesis predicted pyruvyltransferase EpsI